MPVGCRGCREDVGLGDDSLTITADAPFGCRVCVAAARAPPTSSRKSARPARFTAGAVLLPANTYRVEFVGLDGRPLTAALADQRRLPQEMVGERLRVSLKHAEPGRLNVAVAAR